MENESKKTFSNSKDSRPELSMKLNLLKDGDQWFTWDGTRVRIGVARSTFYPGSVSIIVDRGRFGMAYVVEKDGLRATNIVWLGGKRAATNLYIRSGQVRASVLEAHAKSKDGGSLGWLIHQM